MTQATTGIEAAPLPAGWNWVKLGDVAVAIRGVTFASGSASSTAQAGLIPCLTTSAVQKQTDWSTKRYIPKGSVRNENQMLRLGDILVSTANSKALVGKSCLVDELPFRCTFGAFVTVIRRNQPVESAWVLMALNSDKAKSFFYQASSNTTNISNLKVPDLLNLQLPLPPLEEQKRIAAILDEQMAAVKKAKKAAEERLEAAKALPAAYLREVFEGVEAEKWPEISISGLFGSKHLVLHKDGNHGSSYPRKNEFVPEGVKFVVAKDIGLSGELNFSDAACLKPSRAKKLKVGWARSGDVLLAHNATVGPVSHVPEGTTEFVVGTSLTIYRCNPELLNAGFLYYSLQAPFFQSQLFSSMSQTTRNQVPITAQRLLTLRIAPLMEQSKLVSELKNNIPVALLAQEIIKKELETIEALPAALLRKAFAGEL